MKAFKLIGAAAAASLLLLTSCLGESNNTVTRAGFGVAAHLSSLPNNALPSSIYAQSSSARVRSSLASLE